MTRRRSPNSLQLAGTWPEPQLPNDDSADSFSSAYARWQKDWSTGDRIVPWPPAAERERLFPHLERIEMPLGAVVYESAQELIANMLGVRREGVTAAAHRLQKLRVIRYSRGRITVLDRKSSNNCVASVMRWSRGKPIGCCRIRCD